jgi:hypothetical protein
MRILCLHGNGTSGAFFSFQTASFRRLLGEEYEYLFLDGPIECDCAAGEPPPAFSESQREIFSREDCIGLEKVSKGPYFKWSAGLAPWDILEGHEYIHTTIKEEGPFDGVMGFSQGTSIATSILLQHEIDSPEEPPPFKFAIFFGSFLVLSPDEGFAQQEYEFSLKNNTDALLNGLRGINLKDDVNGSCQDDATDRSNKKRSEEVAAEFADILASSVKAAVDIQVALESDIPKDVSNELKDIPRMYHPLLLTQRVKVPTVVCVVSFQIHNGSQTLKC